MREREGEEEGGGEDEGERGGRGGRGKESELWAFLHRQSFAEMLGIDLLKAGALIEPEKEKDLLKT